MERKKYKNLCISPLYVNTVGAHIEVDGEFINEENDELRSLVRDRKLEIIGSQNEPESRNQKKPRKSEKKTDDNEEIIDMEEE